MFNGSANTDAQSRLAARKLIGALSSRPDELMRYLNRESSIFSKTADPTVLAALRILQLFYDQVKMEVCAASEANARESETFHFLSTLDDETCRSLVARYAHEIYPKEWQEIGVNKRSPKKQVPSNVPSLGCRLNERAESDNSSTITEKSSKSSDSSRSKRIVEVSISSSSSSSSPDRKILRSSERKLSSRPTTQQRQQVDRSCSPIGSTNFGMEPIESTRSANSRQRFSTQRSLNDVADLVSQISMGVQTDAVKIDASTRTHFKNGSSLTSTPQSTDKSTSTSNVSSSIASSEHSVGQISMQRAVFLTTRANYRMMTVGRDGSIQPTFNMPYPLDHSTPVYRRGDRTTIRDLEPQEERQENNTRRIERGHLQQMGSSTESPLIAAEQSIRSSNETRVSEVVEDLAEEVDNDDQPTEEDVSTLNQISPLPTE